MSRRNDRSKRAKRRNGFESWFDKMFVNAGYEEKSEESIDLNKAKIPKLCCKDKTLNYTLKETKVSMKQIGMQLHCEIDPRSLCQGALQTLKELERQEQIPKEVLQKAKKLRADLNPDFTFPDSSKTTPSLTSGLQGSLDATPMVSGRSASCREIPMLAKPHARERRTMSGRIVKARKRLCED